MSKVSAARSQTSGFIITKPLQLMVVLAMIEQLPGSDRRSLLVVDAFADAEKIAARTDKYRSVWGRVHFFPSHEAAFGHCLVSGYDNLFMDSDVGFKKHVELLRLYAKVPACRFAVYEEGIGTYRTDLYSGWRKKALSIFGAGVHFGGNRMVSAVYVFEPEEYQHNFGHDKAIGISCTLLDLVTKYSVELFDIFGVEQVRSALKSASTSSHALIYLSGWEMDPVALQALQDSAGMKILKPHPRRIFDEDAAANPGLFVVPPGMPAEILLLIVSDLFDTVKIFHHGTSALRYIQKPSFEYVLLNQVTLTRFN